MLCQRVLRYTDSIRAPARLLLSDFKSFRRALCFRRAVQYIIIFGPIRPLP